MPNVRALEDGVMSPSGMGSADDRLLIQSRTAPTSESFLRRLEAMEPWESQHRRRRLK